MVSHETRIPQQLHNPHMMVQSMKKSDASFVYTIQDKFKEMKGIASVIIFSQGWGFSILKLKFCVEFKPS